MKVIIILTFIFLFIVILFKRIVLLFIFFIPLRIFNKKAHRFYSTQNFVNKTTFDSHSSNKKSVFLKSSILNFVYGFNRYCDFQCGRIPSHFIRNFLYRNIWLVKISKKAIIYWGAEIRAGYNLVLGEGSIVGDNSLLDARQGITIGRNVNLSSRVSIYTEQHDHRDPYFKNNSDSAYGVKIDDRVWIGPNVIILHSVHIGEGAVIAAGSVVTKSISPFSIVAGIPAKKIGERNKNLKFEFDGNFLPFY
jgi:acetyltransferase-like isoleucine patch superfamily enzyme